MRKLIAICVIVAMSLLTAGAANAEVTFEDDFDSPTLAPEWVLSPGAGSLSLTDNPGSLRYTVDAYGTGRTGGDGYTKSLWLTRP